MLEEALAKTPDFINYGDIFHYAMKSGNFHIAEQVVQFPEFKYDEDMPILSRWHLPMHTAVSHHQVNIVELLVDRKPEWMLCATAG